MIDSFIQNGLNMMILHVSSRPKFICVLTSIGPSNSGGRGKNSLLLDDLLQMTNDIKFDNPLFMFTCSCMLCREPLELHTVCWWLLHGLELQVNIWNVIPSVTRRVRMDWLYRTSSWSKLIYIEIKTWSTNVYSFAQRYGYR